MSSSSFRFQRTRLLAGGRSVRTSHLVQTPAAVVGYVSGRPFRPSGTASSSPYGIYRFVVPGSGLIHRLPGAPLGDGTAIWLHAEDSNPFTVTYTTSNVAASRDLTIRVVARGRQIQAAAGPLVEATTQHAAAAYVMIAPSKPGAAARFGSGRWFLELSDERLFRRNAV